MSEATFNVRRLCEALIILKLFCRRRQKDNFASSRCGGLHEAFAFLFAVSATVKSFTWEKVAFWCFINRSQKMWERCSSGVLVKGASRCFSWGRSFQEAFKEKSLNFQQKLQDTQMTSLKSYLLLIKNDSHQATRLVLQGEVTANRGLRMN